jgi:tRNA-dihydrouridine synthase B
MTLESKTKNLSPHAAIVPLKIGNLELALPFFQSALSGYSDRAMRLLAREFGSPLTMPGVMLDTTTVNPTVIRKHLNHITEDEHPIGGQIMGVSPEVMAEAAKVLENLGYDMIDLNFACPAPKVLRRKRGGCLLSKPDDLMAIFRAVRDAVSCPIAMKLRVGFDEVQESLDHFWTVCESAVAEGVDALAIHGRTVLQRYRGFPDWKTVAKVKRRFPHATIIGSGNLFNAQAVVKRLRDSGVDGVLIARGGIGNPWIFQEARAILEGRDIPAPSLQEQGDVILRHFNMMVEDYFAPKALGMFRKFSVQYSRRHPERKQVQTELMAAESVVEFRRLIDQWYDLR